MIYEYVREKVFPMFLSISTHLNRFLCKITDLVKFCNSNLLVLLFALVYTLRNRKRDCPLPGKKIVIINGDIKCLIKRS